MRAFPVSPAGPRSARRIALLGLLAACAAAPPPAVPAKPATATGNLVSLVAPDDYPRAALRNHEEGIVAVRLDIDASGGVSACTVTGSSGSAILDSATCTIMQQRARFTPARNEKGQPVADVFTQRIAWRIAAPPPRRQGNLAGYISMDDYPVEALRRGEQGVVEVRLDIDTAGRASACTVTASSGSAILDQATCRLLTQRARFSPARDEQGQPVTDSYTQKIAWRISQHAGGPELVRATNSYFQCLVNAARPLAAGTASEDEIADRAFAACPEEARNLTAVASNASSGAPPGAFDDLQHNFRGPLIGAIRAFRNQPEG